MAGLEELEVSTLMGITGFIIGIAFGWVTHRTNFCAMGAVSDIISFGDWRRMRAWMLAMATAIAGAQTLHLMGLIDLTRSIYLNSAFPWLGIIIGGLIFGFGMVIGGGCPGRNLMRVGNGDLKALVVLFFIGWAGYMAMRGILAMPRIWLRDLLAVNLSSFGLSDQGIATIISGLTGLSPSLTGPVVAFLFAAGLAGFAFKDAGFRRSPRHVLAGLLLGGLVVAAWAATGILGYDEFEPVQITGLTFIAPTGDAFQYLMTWTGSTIKFGIATVFGAILGSFISSKLTGSFHLSTFVDTPDTVRNMLGGVLMGFGGILALGCTIGQGITGMSTLAAGSILATLSIIAGGVAGVKYMEKVLDI